MLSRLIDDICTVVRMQTVSSDPAHRADLRRCAEWLVTRLRGIGFGDASVLRAAGHPVVCATWRGQPHQPTLLIYGHYDVQPAGDESAWHSPPFEPVRRGEYLFGRGTADDKGPLLAMICGLETALARHGALPVNVTCLFEGEEEIGSASLARLMTHQPRLFAADAALIADTRSPDQHRPAVTFGLRGLLSVEIRLRSAQTPLHAGHLGGAAPGAAAGLARFISRLHEDSGRVRVPGFYNNVRAVSARWRAELARTGPPALVFPRNGHSIRDWGEPGFSPFERTVLRPALTPTAFESGHTDRASYVAAVPAEARARLDVRLVPDQMPADVLEGLREFAEVECPDLPFELESIINVPPVLLDPTHPVMRSMAAACARAFSTEPEFHRSGATIPVVSWLHHRVRLPAVLLGMALEDDRRHAPDERLHLPTLERGVEATVAFMEELAIRGCS